MVGTATVGERRVMGILHMRRDFRHGRDAYATPGAGHVERIRGGLKNGSPTLTITTTSTTTTHEHVVVVS